MPDKSVTIIVLKEYARDISRTPEQVSEDIETIAVKPGVVRKIIEDYAAVIAADMGTNTYPNETMTRFQDPENNSGLTIDDIRALEPLLKKQLDKLMKQASPSQEQKPAMSAPPQYPQNDPSLPPSPDQMTSNAALLKNILERLTRQHPSVITSFISGFTMSEQQLMANPLLFRETLRINFGPMVADTVMNLFNTMRGQYVVDQGSPYGQQQPQMPFAMPGMAPPQGGMPGFGAAPGMAGGMPLPPGMMQDPNFMKWYYDKWFQMMREEEEDRRMERQQKAQQAQLQQYTNMLMSTMTARMMEAQTPTNFNSMGGGAWEEILDPNTGKVVGRRQIQTNMYGGGNSNNSHDTVYAEMIKTLSAERNTLMQSLLNGNKTDINQAILNSLLQMANTRIDPLAQLNQWKTAMPELFRSNQQPMTLELLEAKWKADMDMMNVKMGFKKMEHEWQREDSERIAADKNMDRLMGGLQTLGQQIIGPAFNNVVAAWAQGNLAKGAPGRGPQQAAQQPGQVPQPMMQQPMAQQPMQSYQPITPDVVEQKRRTLESFTDEQLEQLARERDMAFAEAQQEGQMVDEERQKRRLMRRGVNPYQAEAAANPQVISDPSGYNPTPPGADPVPGR